MDLICDMCDKKFKKGDTVIAQVAAVYDGTDETHLIEVTCRWCQDCEDEKPPMVSVPRKALERLLNYTKPYEKKSFEEHSDNRERHIWKDMMSLRVAL